MNSSLYRFWITTGVVFDELMKAFQLKKTAFGADSQKIVDVFFTNLSQIPFVAILLVVSFK